MARRGYGLSNLSNEEKKDRATVCPTHRRRRERLDAYDTTPAKTVLAVVGVAVVILLLWLDYRGY